MKQRGFTLVEVLIAMTLVSMILVMAYSGLSAGTRAVSRGEEIVDRMNHLRIVQTFLRRQISNMMPLQIRSDEVIEGQEYIYFEADDRSLRFAGPMPGYLSNGGPHEQRIFVDGGDLLFEHRVLVADADWVDPEPRDPIVLLEGLASARFEYLIQSEDGEDFEWRSDWEEPTLLPLMVRLDIELDRELRVTWPLMEIRPRIDGAGTGQRSTRPFVLPTSRDRP